MRIPTTAILLLLIMTATAAAEQPTAVIEVSPPDGETFIAGDGDYVEVIACEEITLSSISLIPTGVGEEKWYIDGVYHKKANSITYTPKEKGHVRITLEVVSGEESDSTSVKIAASRNDEPELKKLVVTTGLDEKEFEFDPDEQPTIYTAKNTPVVFKREYENDDMLAQEVTCSGMTILDRDCGEDFASTTVEFE